MLPGGNTLGCSLCSPRSSSSSSSQLPPLKISALSLSPVELNENNLDGQHLVIPCTISVQFGEATVQTRALIDCGASGFSFVDEEFARHYSLPITPLQQPRVVEVIDGSPISSGDIPYLVRATLEILEHREQLPMFVTKLGQYPLVLGIPWLWQHDVAIQFASNRITFNSEFCLAHCNKCPTTIWGAQEEPRAPQAASLSPPAPQAASLLPPAPQAASLSSPAPQAASHLPPVSQAASLSPPAPQIASLPPAAPPKNSIIGDASFMRPAKRKKLQILSTTLYELNRSLDRKTIEEDKLEELIHEEYHDFLHMFSEIAAQQLPPHRPYNHSIPLKDGFNHPFGLIYSLSRVELEALREWWEDNLSKGFIRSSLSPAGAPILFVKKPGGSLRLSVDYRVLNEGTIKNRYPLPLLRETLLRLQKARYYTKLDVLGVYNLIRIAAGEAWKTAFPTWYGLFESLVMPFWLTNAPASFQHFINDILRPFLDIFISTYLNDILSFLETLKEYKKHVRQVLEALSDAGLHLAPKKCEFHKESVKYLGFILNTGGVAPDPAKVTTAQEWGTKKCPVHCRRDGQHFLGFAGFYRRFIRNYSCVVLPLTRLTGEHVPFDWSPECEPALNTLKTAFTSAPVLHHFDHDREVIVVTYAFDFISTGVLSQYGDDSILHPVALYSEKHSPAEYNYEIYDKELMAIFRAFEEWRPELEGALFPIQVLSDHKNLEYFMSTKLLNRCQTHWAVFLSRFNFNIQYRPGKAGGKPDALTRRSGDLP